MDTNVVIDAQNEQSPFYAWSNRVIATALSQHGAGINAITLAELCSADGVDSEQLQAELRSAGIQIMDLPVGAAVICGRAYRRYRISRARSGGGEAPHIPLPDFFIGAHAQLMDWKLATRDVDRYRTYFPDVKLIEPGS